MNTQALIIGKFMPPHIGHKFLIDFATSYDGVDRVDVCVFSMPTEPIEGGIRYQALCDHYQKQSQNLFATPVYVHWHDEVLPQEPHEHPDFWAIWKSRLEPYIKKDHKLLVFASELYGEPLAQHLGGTFVPVNIGRSIVPTSGTTVRKNITQMWHLLIPEARKQLVRPITLFGADSCGKTTTAKQVAYWYEGQFIPEYARGYLEVKGTDITPEKMWEIAKGQYAQDVSTLDNSMHRMVIRDTDLLTTYGYLKLFNIELSPQQMAMLRVMINSSYSDLYVIMDTDIPFAVDSQRYGGDKRQSDNQFWIDILEQFKLNYVVVGGEFNGFEHNPRRNNVVAAINKFYRDQNKI